jgi:predicted GH43/DUF377 family glycosyl hydrolase
MDDLVKRNPLNPLIRPEDLVSYHPEMKVECVLNPGVFEFDGKVYLVVRVAERPIQEEGKITIPMMDNEKIKFISFDHQDPLLDRSDPREPRYKGETYLSTISHLRILCSEDGNSFKDAGLPDLNGSGSLESYGIEDCRVTKMQDDSFILTYTATSPSGYGVGMRRTKNWKTYEELGMILPPANKDCAIFEKKIKRKYFCFHRPSGVGLGGNYIWLASSPDLINWGGHECIAHTRPGMWDSSRIGAGAAPIETEDGWLAIYHGADEQSRYCLGALLLDRRNPAKVLARSNSPIMEPIEDYEQKGFFGNVVFTNGHTVKGDKVTLYYGASDSVICSADLSISAILKTL